MVVNEKGLLKAMKDAYRGVGYKVAAEEDEDGTVSIIVAAPAWIAIIEQKNMPRKALGLIAEHVGTIPVPGEAYMVRVKEDTQTEIYGMALRDLNSLREEEQQETARIVKRTNITLGGYRIWQRQKDLACLMIDPIYEGIIDAGKRSVRTVGENAITVDGLASRVYIFRESVRKHTEASMKHLSQMQWITVE